MMFLFWLSSDAFLAVQSQGNLFVLVGSRLFLFALLTRVDTTKNVNLCEIMRHKCFLYAQLYTQGLSHKYSRWNTQ